MTTTDRALFNDTGRADAAVAGAFADPAPLGALRLWHAELRAKYLGQDAARPSTWRYDVLYRAARWEEHGLDAIRAGLPVTAAYCFRRARSLIADAARARQGAA